MKLGQLLEHVAPSFAERVAKDLTADSRQVKKGSVFVAVPGTKADGSLYVGDALKKGAVAIVAQSDLSPDVGDQAAFIQVPDARQALTDLALRFYPAQPDAVVAVTGTSGKSSVVDFTRQILIALGHQAASLGTIGVVKPDGATYGSLTTPDPVSLHKTLDTLAREGITHLAMEASSHGLVQKRLDGVRLAAVGFTNLGRDHLDYHPTLEDYFIAKLRLFDSLARPGTLAIINVDDIEHAPRVLTCAVMHGLVPVEIGRRGRDLRLANVLREADGQVLDLVWKGIGYQVKLPLIGDFQASNALVALGFALALGADPAAAVATLATLKGVPGRMEPAGSINGASVLVDYAHKPDALAHVLDTLKPYAAGRLIVVFGCGGDRDAGKRPLMGQIASAKADLVIVTDDNPRSEEPAAIRAAILAAAPGAQDVADRAEAIRTAIGLLEPGDILVVAGKGHETGQIVGDQVLPFSDHAVVAEAIAARRKANKKPVKSRQSAPQSEPAHPMETQSMAAPLWTGEEARMAMGADRVGALPASILGISIDSRTIQPGELYVAIKGDVHDGHAFVVQALEKGAAAALVAKAKLAELGGQGPFLAVDDPLEALIRLGLAARARNQGQIVAVTGSVGKTGTKEALQTVLGAQGLTHASVASFNNHWGVPLTLARFSRAARYGVFEIGMNHPFEILPLVGMVRPHVAMITTVAPVHLAHFQSVQGIADAKGEIFAGLEHGGTAILPADSPYADRLSAHARASRAGRIITFGESEKADVRLIAASLKPDMSTVEASVFGMPVAYRLGSPGKHVVLNSLGVMAAVVALGADPAQAALSFAQVKPPSGRGERMALRINNGTLHLIDESYNANPASMRAALDNLGRIDVGLRGRRIAVMGDMLELGPTGPDLHAGLSEAVEQNDIHQVFACGPLMRHLWEALPESRRGAYAGQSADLEVKLLNALRPDDVVTVKGSLGSKMGPIVKAIINRFPKVETA
jgi:MurE/MurF fusion protein